MVSLLQLHSPHTSVCRGLSGGTERLFFARTFFTFHSSSTDWDGGAAEGSPLLISERCLLHVYCGCTWIEKAPFHGGFVGSGEGEEAQGGAAHILGGEGVYRQLYVATNMHDGIGKETLERKTRYNNEKC